jgi:hypothetical protein
MEKIIGNDYRFRLNENTDNYHEILSDINKEIQENKKLHTENGKGSWDGHVQIENHDIKVFMSANYENAPIKLSPLILKRIKDNVRTKPEEAYFYTVDVSGINPGTIRNCEGFAKTLAQKIDDMEMYLYEEDGIQAFNYYMAAPSEIHKLDKLGEKKRLQRKLLNNSYEITFNKCFTDEKKEFNDLWIAYFLVHGTKDPFTAKTNYYPQKLSLKEILYFEDNNGNGKTKGSWGKTVLKHLNRAGVVFDEGTKDITGNLIFGGKIGEPIRSEDPEVVNEWFHKNKIHLFHVPKFSKDTIETLQREFPATFERLDKIMSKKILEKSKKSHKPR